MDTRRGFTRSGEGEAATLPSHTTDFVPTAIAPGATLDGRYLLHEVIGHGGMGTVYRAKQVALARTVAVKVLDPQLVDDQVLRRFQDEATTAGRLRHPNTVSVLDVGVTADGTPYLVMEFVRGRSLKRLLSDDDVPSLRRGSNIIAQTLAALEDAHLAGIVHADVKSDNVMVEEIEGGTDAVKLVDFGLARFVGLRPPDLEDRVVAGTPEFMAPEVIRGERPTVASDLYAAGVMLYEVLTGLPPFIGGSSAKVLSMHLFDVVIPPSLRRPERSFSPALERVVARALAKSPETRFATATEFAEALASATMATPEDPLRRCPGCSQLRPSDSKFCPECGALAFDAVAHRGADKTTENLAHPLALPAHEEQHAYAAIQAALRSGNLEEAAGRYLSTAKLLASQGRPHEGVRLLKEAVAGFRSRATSTTRAALLLWPLLATMARLLDAAGDRLEARRIAAQAERQALCARSAFGRDATRLLLLHLALRKT